MPLGQQLVVPIDIMRVRATRRVVVCMRCVCEVAQSLNSQKGMARLHAKAHSIVARG